MRRLLIATALAACALAGDADSKGLTLRYVGGASGAGAPVTPCATSLVFDQTVACNAVAVPLMGM
jgi:hypothetical protein